MIIKNGNLFNDQGKFVKSDISCSGDKIDVIKDNNLNNLEKKLLIEDFDTVFALDLTDTQSRYISNDKINYIESLLKKRDEYRKNKNWQKSDEIRDILLNDNIKIIDSKDGSKWTLL